MTARAVSHQIVHFLKRSHTPCVTVAESPILGINLTRAGRGVFSKKNVCTNDLPKVMCLYPGIYTPGIPLHAMGDAEYLANQSPPSFNGDIAENAYILNLTCGGYIDGLALESQHNKHDALDSNPSACGHLVNHHAIRSNVEVFSFSWCDLAGQDANTVLSTDKFSIPNELRQDGSPWYYDSSLDKLVSFPGPDQPPLPQKMVCGAALVLTKPILQGEELLLDYGLKEPYPKWAKGWYCGS